MASSLAGQLTGARFGFVQEAAQEDVYRKAQSAYSYDFQKKINFDIFGNILTLRFAAKRRVWMSPNMSKLIFLLKIIVISHLGRSMDILLSSLPERSHLWPLGAWPDNHPSLEIHKGGEVT